MLKKQHSGLKFQYIKLALPHVGLVFVVCCYAAIGAYIFYRLESPNEDYVGFLELNLVYHSLKITSLILAEIDWQEHSR